jgi:thiaminase
MDVSEEQYTSDSASPMTRAFGDFLVRTGYEGDFFDIATVLFVT